MHAKAAGAFGAFEVTHDISDITSAKFLNGIGTTTPVMLRNSTVAGERGSANTVRDVRGWAMKFFTQEENQDWVFNDTVRCFRPSSLRGVICLYHETACLLHSLSNQIPFALEIQAEAISKGSIGPQSGC